ncbi:MAG: hypothetical protein AAF799_29785 [Myxococcota bacterium]
MAIQSTPYPYLGNQNTKEYHYPQNRKSGCQLEKIKQRTYFRTRSEAGRAGYDPCNYCLDGSTR